MNSNDALKGEDLEKVVGGNGYWIAPYEFTVTNTAGTTVWKTVELYGTYGDLNCGDKFKGVCNGALSKPGNLDLITVIGGGFVLSKDCSRGSRVQ